MAITKTQWMKESSMRSDKQASYSQRLLITHLTGISYFGQECSFTHANFIIGLAMQYKQKYGKFYRKSLLNKLNELKIEKGE